ncbi:MAG: hypothetical protein ACOYOS_10405, partial [Syntrophales bacterium]
RKMNLINHVMKICLSNKNFRDLVLYKLRALRLQITVDSGGDAPKKKYRFDLPEEDVKDLFRLFSLNRSKLGCIFCTNADPFSQILLILTAAAICISDQDVAKESYTLLLCKLWNDHSNMYFPSGIDAVVMDRVIKEKLCMKHLLKKYRTPYRLIEEYFMPELLKKYKYAVVADTVNNTAQLLNQAKRRIDQLFESNWIIDNKTSNWRPCAGLVPFYEEILAEIKKKAAA